MPRGYCTFCPSITADRSRPSYSVGSPLFGTPQFPLSDVPLQKIAARVASGRLKAKPTRIFRFEEIREAHRVMQANEARGKMVVVVHD